ncbi:DUF3789 domain-containing protein, partial [Enterococcus faecium]|nr:DUF3789 domain-containing protein [Enterococcus faecium]
MKRGIVMEIVKDILLVFGGS